MAASSSSSSPAEAHTSTASFLPGDSAIRIAVLDKDKNCLLASNAPIVSRGRRGVDDECELRRVHVHHEGFMRLLRRTDVEKLEVTQRCNGYTTYLRFYLDLSSYPDRYFEYICESKGWVLEELTKPATQVRPDSYDGTYSNPGSGYTIPETEYMKEFQHAVSKRMFRVTLVEPGRWIFRQIEDPIDEIDVHGMCPDHWHSHVPAWVRRCPETCTNPVWTCGADCYFDKQKHVCK